MSYLTSYLTALGYFLLDVAVALIPFVLFLALFRIIIKLRYRLSGVDLDDGLDSSENNAVNILVVGLFFGLMFAFHGLAFTRESTLLQRTIHVALFGLLAIVLQFVAQIVANKVILRHVDDIQQVFEHHNNSVALVKAAIAVATGQMVATTGGGTITHVSQALIWFAIGQTILILLGLFYQWMTPYDVHKELEKHNMAVGLGFSGVIIAGGLVVSRAVSGGVTTDWGKELLSVITFIVTILLIALVMRRLFDWIVLPKVSMNEEISAKHNIGIGLVEASAFILPAAYFVRVI
jgi:uncharacterized membrane protein YjfL (UPF0719 family)